MSEPAPAQYEQEEPAPAQYEQEEPAPAQHEQEEKPKTSKKQRLFNRERPLHAILGGGKAADSFLWKNKLFSGGILIAATVVYFVLEHSGYTLLAIIANLLLVFFTVLFIWSNAALFLNRSPPPLPDLKISEDVAKAVALALQQEINKVLAIAHEIALGKDFKHFIKLIFVLWGLSVVGGWLHFLTIAYIVVVFAHTVPVVYDTYEDQIEEYARCGVAEAQKHYKKLDEKVLHKIFKKIPKLKKSE